MEEKPDMRFLPREFLTDFIKQYQNLPCLWNMKLKDYTNRSIKKKAYEKLLLFCQRTYPDADVQFVKNKIQTLRASFRKELRKIKRSKQFAKTPNEIRKPHLWYFKLLLFVQEQEEQLDDNTLDDNAIITADDHEEIFASPLDIITPQDDNTQSSVEDAASSSSSAITMNPQKLTKSDRSSDDTNPTKIEHDLLLKRCFDSTLDEFDIVGRNVTMKLRQMDFQQRILAESLIQQILTKGLFGELTRTTSIDDRFNTTNYMEFTDHKIE